MSRYPFTICNAESPIECERDTDGNCARCKIPARASMARYSSAGWFALGAQLMCGPQHGTIGLHEWCAWNERRATQWSARVSACVITGPYPPPAFDVDIAVDMPPVVALPAGAHGIPFADLQPC